jgi:hypothetical protein
LFDRVLNLLLDDVIVVNWLFDDVLYSLLNEPLDWSLHDSLDWDVDDLLDDVISVHWSLNDFVLFVDDDFSWENLSIWVSVQI